MNREEWYEMTEELFMDLFKGSAVKRTGYSGIKRNLDFLLKERTDTPGNGSPGHL